MDFKIIDPTEATFTLASAAISVAERLLTSAVTYTSPDIYQGSAHTVSLDIRDKTSGVTLPDIAWSVSLRHTHVIFMGKLNAPLGIMTDYFSLDQKIY